MLTFTDPLFAILLYTFVFRSTAGKSEDALSSSFSSLCITADHIYTQVGP